jgi:long-chain acyl-CoA synthetase
MVDKSLIKSIENSLKKHWDLPALSDYNGSTNHYKDVARNVAKLHILFEESGLKKGDKVAICGKNSANWGTAFLAAFTYGAVAVPILSDFKPDNIHNIVNHSEARMLFASASIWENMNSELIPDVETFILLNDFSIIKSQQEHLYDVRERLNEHFGKKYPKDFGPENVTYFVENPEELALINYTSGTTGFSKGVMLPYKCLHNNMVFAYDVLYELKAGDTVVSMLPTAHMYGFSFEFLYEIITGCHIQFLTKMPTPKIILQAFAELKPRLIITVPLILEKIYKKTLLPKLSSPIVRTLLHIPVVDQKIRSKINNELTKVFGGNFIEVIIGGAAFNPEIESFFKKIGFRYTVGYGMTECGPIITYDGWKNNKLHSCGKKTINMEVRIDSPDPQHIVGEVHTKGPNVMLGYFRNEEATREQFTADGWMKTGDLGIIDRDGYLFLKGRNKNLILGPSGQNIYPEEIESKINTSSYVMESIVVEQNGKIVALVYPDYELLKEDHKDPEETMNELLTLVNAELPVYSQIAKIKSHPEEFEKTPKRSIKRFIYQ